MLGLIARGDLTGLAVQTWCFYRRMNPDRVLLVDLSRWNGMRPDASLYPGAALWEPSGFPGPMVVADPVLDEFLAGLDCVFTAETPYNWYLLERAAQLGVRTVVQPNYEFMPLDPALPQASVLALPTPWHEEDYRRALPATDVRVVPVPVETALLPHRPRTQLRTILHTAGTGTAEDRNGTQILLDAMQRVRTPVRAIVRAQRPLGARAGRNVQVVVKPVSRFWELYSSEDAYVMPRRFGGLCLPAQEALACGMPVIMSDLSPQRDMLPPDALVPAVRTGALNSRNAVDVHAVDPERLACELDCLYESPDVVQDLSERARQWAKEHSWEALLPAYLELCTSSP